MTGGDRPTLVTRPFVNLSAAALAFYLAAGLIIPVTPRFVEDRLGGGSAEVGIVFAAFAVASLLLRPLVGWSSDRFGRRPLLLGGTVLTVAGMLLHVVAADLPVLVTARALLGSGEGFFLVAALAAASDLAPPDRRGEALSFLSLSLYLGLAIGPLIGETILAAGGFGLVWAVTTGVAAVSVALCLLVPETAPIATSQMTPRRRTPIIHPAGLFPGLIILCGMWGMAGFFAFLPGYAVDIGLGGASLPLLVYALIVVILRVGGARIPDRYGSVPVATVALALAAGGLAIIGLLATPAGLMIGTAVFAVGVAFIMPAVVSLAVSRVSEVERGSVVGTTAVFLDLAFGTAPVVIGLMAAGTGAGPTFLLSAVIAAAGAVVLIVRRGALSRAALAPAR